MQQVEVDRAYRIIAVMEHTAKVIRDELMPRLDDAKQRWRRRVLWLDAIVFGLLGVAGLVVTAWLGWWQGLSFQPPGIDAVAGDPVLLGVAIAIVVAVIGYIHFSLRRIAARSLLPWLRDSEPNEERRGWLLNAFKKNTSFWRSIFWNRPAGWDRWSKRRIERVLTEADRYVQSLNNRFADPSGAVRRGARPAASQPAAAAPKAPAAEGVAQPHDYADPQSDEQKDTKVA